MSEPVSIYTLLSPLGTIIARIFPTPMVRRIYAERSAARTGHMPPEVLDECFRRTLTGLTGGAADDSWLKALPAEIRKALVASPALKEARLQEWLREPTVQNKLMALARSRLVGTPDPPEVRKPLIDLYEAMTGEPREVVDAPIDTLISVLCVGYCGDLTQAERKLLAHTTECHAETRSHVERVLGAEFKALREDLRRTSSRQTFDWLDSEFRKELLLLRQRYSLHSSSPTSEVRSLVEKVEKSQASDAVKVEVLDWAARIHAREVGSLDEARRFRARLLEIDPQADTRIIDAYCKATSGDADGAIRDLRDVDTAECRTALLGIRLQHKEESVALDWLDQHPGRESLGLLTPGGWFMACMMLASAGRWLDAAKSLQRTHEVREQWPELAFLEAVVHVALLMPGELREQALGMNIFHRDFRPQEGSEADEHRCIAEECFASAASLLQSVDAQRAESARQGLSWLHLTSPDGEVRARARTELEERLRDPKEGARLLQVALTFDLSFDENELWMFLERRRLLGGLETEEKLAHFLLAQRRLPPREFLAFLDAEEDSYVGVLIASYLAFSRIEALRIDGQIARARRHAEKSKSLLGKDYDRLSALLDAMEGQDPRRQFEELYETTNSLVDLKNLVHHLAKVGDWSAARPLAIELFKRERTGENARRAIACVQKDDAEGDRQAVEFLDAASDLVKRDVSLRSVKAWALLRLGKLEECAAELVELRKSRRSPDDLELEISLLLQGGAWESFPSVVDREWPRRDSLEARTLLRLSYLAALVDETHQRAFDLAKEAVSRGEEDPYLLTEAIALGFRLGREGAETQDWLERAVAKSTAEGPVTRIEFRRMVEEFLPAVRESVRWTNEAILQGEIPLHLAAIQLNMSLAEVILGSARSNELEVDARRRIIVPVFSGARVEGKVEDRYSVIGLDITTILLLKFLGLLKEVLEAFNSIVIAPDTMLQLLHYRTQARHHQPSQLRLAEEISNFASRGLILWAENLETPPAELAGEVGVPLAQLLSLARRTGGLVAHPRPIWKVKSYLSEAASLDDYDATVLSVSRLAELLHANGAISSATFESAMNRLEGQDKGDSSLPEVELRGPLYADWLGFRLIQQAKLVQGIKTAGLELRVHPVVREEQEALRERGTDGLRIEREIEEIRLALKAAIAEGRVQFLPRHPVSEEDQPAVDAMTTVLQFIDDLGPCEALVVDDRYLNRHAMITSRRGGQAAVLSTLDLLVLLERKQTISKAKRFEALHRLRESGFAFVPPDIEEMTERLRSTGLQGDGPFVETAELRCIRQSLARWRSLNAVRDQSEHNFLGRLQVASWYTVRKVWEEPCFTLDRKKEVTTWIWRHIAPSPEGWLHSSAAEDLVGAVARHLAVLLEATPVMSEDVNSAWIQLADGVLFAPLVASNEALVERASQKVGEWIKAWARSARRELPRVAFVERLTADMLFSQQPTIVQEFLLSDPDFLSATGIEVATWIQFEDLAKVPLQELLDAARALFARRRGRRSVKLGENRGFAERVGGALKLRLRASSGQEISPVFSEFGLVSEVRKTRESAADWVIGILGPTFRDASELRSLVGKRALSDPEMIELRSRLSLAPNWVERRIESIPDRGAFAVGDLVPSEWEYYEQLAGPVLGPDEFDTYLQEVVPSYRKELLARDLRGGLRVCLIGSLRDDLCPGGWLSEFDDDSVWSALGHARPEGDLFSLLGALDVAVYRSHDERFREFAERTVATLCQDRLERPDGVDLYELSYILGELAYNRMSVGLGGARRAPVWRRSAAWMHAAVLVRALAHLRLDIEKFREAAGAAMDVRGRYLALTDLWWEPMSSVLVWRLGSLRGVVLGRLVQMQARHEGADRKFPGREEIQAALVRSASTSSPLSFFLPGPLEGRRRPRPEAVIPQDLKEFLRGGDLPGETAARVAYLSHLFAFDQETRDWVREQIELRGRELVRGEEVSREVKLLAMVAAASGEGDIASAIGRSVEALAPTWRSEESVAMGLQALLIAAAAFPTQGERLTWAEESIARFAVSLGGGPPCRILWEHLQVLKSVTPIETAYYRQAEAFAQAGFRELRWDHRPQQERSPTQLSRASGNREADGGI